MDVEWQETIYESAVEQWVAPEISDVMIQEDSGGCCTSSGTTHCTPCLGTFFDLNLITAAESESNVEGVLRRSMARASGEALFVSSGYAGWILLD